MAQDRYGQQGDDGRGRRREPDPRQQAGEGPGRFGPEDGRGGYGLGAAYGYHFGQHPAAGMGRGYGPGYGEAGPERNRPGEPESGHGRGSRDRSGALYGKGQRRIDEGPYRGRGPKGYRRPDARILDDLNDRLTDDPRLDATEVDVQVHDGEVTLSGQVRSREDKRRAELLAEQCSGVAHVQNNLRVQPA